MNYNKFQDNKPYELKTLNAQPLLYPSNPQINYAPTGKVPSAQVPTNQTKAPSYIKVYASQPIIYQPQLTQTPIPINYPSLNNQQLPSFNPSYMYYPNQGMPQFIDNSASDGTSKQISKPISKQISKPVTNKKDYYNEILPDYWMRTPILGMYKDGSVEFDDYYEKLQDIFLTPEIDEIKIWHTNDYLWGIQIIYRDSWGKQKEYYKGNPHLGRNQSSNNFTLSTFKLRYDDNIVEIRGNEGIIITGLHIKTFLGREFKVGKLDNLGENLVEPLTKAVSIGGSHNGFCLESLYFYLV